MLIQMKQAPRKQWYYLVVYISYIQSMTEVPNYELKEMSYNESLTGDTPNILSYLEFEWYNQCWYISHMSLTGDNRKLGRYFGVAHKLVKYLCCLIFTYIEAHN